MRHYTHANYKFNDTGWFDDKRAHLWVVDVASGGATQITAGDDWNDTDPQWSPDGRKIAFVSDRTGKAFDVSREHRRLGDRRGRRTADEDLRRTRSRTTRRAGRPTARRSRSSAPYREAPHPKIWLARGRRRTVTPGGRRHST